MPEGAGSMELDRKALYNLVRMNWLNDPEIDAEPWQIEDYRCLTPHTILEMLHSWDIALNEQEFIRLAEECDSPEFLTDFLTEDLALDPQEQDQIYLLIFELWRQLLPEKQCLSIFCDELDHQIYLYDQGKLKSAEEIQDTIANLQVLMDENYDSGAKPKEIFATVASSCANDLKTFLFDYIAEAIDNEQYSYATELCEGFDPYLKGEKWFELLKIRLLDLSDHEGALNELRKIVQKAIKEEDCDFNMELLAFILQAGEKGELQKIIKATLPLLKTEEDFLEVLAITADYYNYNDDDQKESQIQQLIDSRKKLPAGARFDPRDQDIVNLLKIIK